MDATFRKHPWLYLLGFFPPLYFAGVLLMSGIAVTVAMLFSFGNEDAFDEMTRDLMHDVFTWPWQLYKDVKYGI